MVTYTSQLCSPRVVDPLQAIIDQVINEDVKYSKTPLDLLNQRTFAVKVSTIVEIDPDLTADQTSSQA